jgi:hypothetical protein
MIRWHFCRKNRLPYYTSAQADTDGQFMDASSISMPSPCKAGERNLGGKHTSKAAGRLDEKVVSAWASDSPEHVAE